MRQHSMYLYCDIQEKFHIKFKSEIALIELINLFLNFDFKMNYILKNIFLYEIKLQINQKSFLIIYSIISYMK